MDKFYLEEVTLKGKNDIIEYIRELYQFNSKINGVGRLQDYITDEKENFENWLTKIKKDEKNKEAPMKQYLFIRRNDNKLIGMTNIRVSTDLKDYRYGHIGYSIRPLERNKGYGKIQLYFALKELKNNNINICQMNCKSNNYISKKIITSLGGLLKKTIKEDEYYQIDIEKTIKEHFYKYNKFF